MTEPTAHLDDPKTAAAADASPDPDGAAPETAGEPAAVNPALRVELVVAVVSPIGIDVTPVCEALTEAFDQYVRYDAKPVRVSRLIEDVVPGAKGDTRNRWRRLMDAGDELRRQTGANGFCAMLAVQAIGEVRRAETGDEDKWRLGGATIVHSLKHPDEIALLRQVYGQRVIVVGVSDARETRETWLRGQLMPGNAAREDEAAAAGEAAELIRRDELDERVEWGQRVREAFEMCDVYLPPGGAPLKDAARRLVELLFAKPFITPSRDEMGVWHAYAAKFRSSAAGRQVGAVLLDGDGEALATGCNDVPAVGGGQNWNDDEHDLRDHALGTDANDKFKFRLAEEMFTALAKAKWLDGERAGRPPAELAKLALAKGDGPLHGTRVANLVEFGRIMHAEMAALMTAARRGTPVRGATLYITTYPCHECMRLIIGAGVDRVVYVDPYPKSMVPELYGEHLAGSATGGSKIAIETFEGVAPRLMDRVFGQVKARKRNERGAYLKWTGRLSTYVGLEDRYIDTARLQESAVGKRLQDHLAALRA